MSKKIHITLLTLSLIVLCVISSMRHIKNWVQLEIMTYLSIAALIITILSTYKKGVTPNTSSEFATSLTFSIFCTWTGGAQFEGSGSLLNTGLLFIVFVFLWFISGLIIRANSSNTLTKMENKMQ